jgi:hypothetical protein
MPFLYFDTSALVKYYVHESGSTWVSSLIDDATNLIFTNDVAIAEVSAALAILKRTNRITTRTQRIALAQFYEDISRRYYLLNLTRAIAFNAAELAQRYPLKGYDAVHLATALTQSVFLKSDNAAVTLIGGDAQMLAAARAEGLPTESPFDHIDLDSRS